MSIHLAEDSQSPAAKRYTALETERSPFLGRARDAAELTIPNIMPRNGQLGGTGGDEMPTPFQSVGARGVNNLTAKLVLTLFPPGSPFFRMAVDRFLLQELQDEAGDDTDIFAEFENALVVIEQEVMHKFEILGSRQVLAEALMHLIVSGNGLLQVGKTGRLKFHRLDQYVVRRDIEGLPMEIIFREGVEAESLPPELSALVKAVIQKEADDSQKSKPLWLYTVAKREDKTWQVHQEIQEFRIEGTEWSYPDAKPAFIPLRWRSNAGEDYGRGFIESYMGDLMSLESLSQSIVEYAAVASKIVHFVDENGLTDKQEIQDAPNGAILDGSAKDITTLQLDKTADFQVAESVAGRIERRIEQAFLLNSSIQRNAERVTAEEIRFMANELATALGGVYSTLATELQRPLVVRLMSTLAREQRLPQLPAGKVDPEIITGIDGLGRTAELQRLDILLAGIGQTLGPEAIQEYVKAGSYIERRAAALGVAVDGMIRSETEVQQIRRKKQEQAVIEKTAGPAVTQMGQLQKEREATTEEA